MHFSKTARTTIDAQYYIWHRDLTGTLLLNEMKNAADRGVRVRLLLDDNGVEGLDDLLVELATHSMVEVKLYNPFIFRRWKPANYLFDFYRLNRRMHNKSMIFDGERLLTGGRNIGDEYFATGPHPEFVDLDVVAVGNVVDSATKDFERYWNSRSAFDVAEIIRPRTYPSASLRDLTQAVAQGDQLRNYIKQMQTNEYVERVENNELDFEPVEARLVSDFPDKTIGKVLAKDLLVDRLSSLLSEIEERFDLISPYFVPGKRGADQLIKLAERGVRVRVLTNSMEANDVPLVHAGYEKYRKRLLKGGVELFELKAYHSPDIRREDAGLIGSSASSLHAKTFCADGERLFVGSFNFDPRSIYLNTEMGLFLKGSHFANRLHGVLDQELDRIAYRVLLRGDNKLVWQDSQSEEVFDSDPHTTWFDRATVSMAGKLPIEWLL